MKIKQSTTNIDDQFPLCPVGRFLLVLLYETEILEPTNLAGSRWSM